MSARRCRRCGASIHWVRLKDNTLQPVDAGGVETLRVGDGNMQGVTDAGELVQGSPTFKAAGVRVRRVHACPRAA